MANTQEIVRNIQAKDYVAARQGFEDVIEEKMRAIVHREYQAVGHNYFAPAVVKEGFGGPPTTKTISPNLSPKFQQVFGVDLNKFWSATKGFDIFEFGRYLNIPKNVPVKDYITRKFGPDAVALLAQLFTGDSQ